MNKYILILLLICNAARAQNFGAFPAKTRWRQINSDTARVIFTGGAEEKAQRVATLLHKMAAQNPVSLGNRMRKINVVLHSNTTIANGYVALAPFRSEFYLIPGANVFEFGNLPWHEHLAIHEYRHVQQYNNLNNGLTKAFSFLFGEEGQALANALTVPDWFFEGDAVYAETALTPQGRGRMPYFHNYYKSLWEAGKDYRWMKLRNGSYKDFVPDHYRLGYLLTNYGYMKYGTDFWQKVSRDASAFRGLLYPFQKAVKRHAGVNFKKFRNNAFQYYREQVKPEYEKPAARGNDKTVTNYYFPQYINDDSLLYLKGSYRQIPAFYVKDSKGEHRIKQRSISSEEWFSYRNGVISYTAYSVHPRRALVDYSDIVLLDIHTKKERRLTQKGKYFTPDISPSGQEVIAVAINDSLQTELHLLNSSDGRLLKKITAKPNDYFLHPKFINEQTIVLVQRMADGRMSLNTMNIETEKTESLVPPSVNTIGFPFVADGTVYFSASYTANDDVYAYHLKERKLHQLTSGQTGNYFPALFKDTLTWSEFTAQGMQVRKWALLERTPAEAKPIVSEKEVIPYPVAGTEKNLLATANQRFSTKRYSQTYRLFNFHSWNPDYTDPEFTVTATSNNILSTFSNELIYRYNRNENSHAVAFNALYGGLLPMLRAGLDYTFNRHVTRNNKELVLNQREAQAGYFIPLNFTQGKTFKLLTFGSNLVYNQLTAAQPYKNDFKEQHSTYLHHYILLRHQLPRALQHIYPHFGYATSVQHRHRLDKSGYQFIGAGEVYLPSFHRNHSIVLGGAFQQTDTSNVLFSNRFSRARGYNEYYLSRMWKATANYHFPLLYPDFGVANIVYLLRLRTNLFFDYSRVYSNNKSRTRNLRSTGAELFFDTQWWNQLPVTVGVRYSYLLDKELSGPTNRHRFEVVLPLDLIPD